jgi:hypothetical protein
MERMGKAGMQSVGKGRGRPAGEKWRWIKQEEKMLVKIEIDTALVDRALADAGGISGSLGKIKSGWDDIISEGHSEILRASKSLGDFSRLIAQKCKATQ